MDDGIVADSDVVSYPSRMVGVNVDGAVVLDAGVPADPNTVQVTPYHSVFPDAAPFSDLYVSNDDCAGRNICGGVNLWVLISERNNRQGDQMKKPKTWV